MRMVTETPGGSAPRAARALRRVLLWTGCALLSGCGTTYLMQAGSGELRVLRARESIARLIADPGTPAPLRTRLTEVNAARAFATAELHLPDNKSYTTYADIGRPYVVWNVVATPEFSVNPRVWCFPVAGCVAYRGYFSERRAREFAADLAVRGFDVVVDGVPAYSTLGKFADPVLSSMLRYDDEELVATIFHELAHQLLYVRNDSQFNEAFATTVEDAGLERWLAHQDEPGRMAQFRTRHARAREFLGLLGATRAQLVRLYATGAPRDELRAGKVRILAALAADIRTLEHRQGLRYPLYDEWLAAGLNNARLASVATYFDCVPGLERLLAENDGDLVSFYAAVRALAQQPRAVRHAQLCTSAASPGADAS
ncbi:MAG: aminopeptidase [Steroidobacterales bacterium]